jgi:uncharacterized RDD family membrane protein YckC
MIRFSCKCGKKIAVDEKHAGKRGKCPLCREIVIIPQHDSTESPDKNTSNSGSESLRNSKIEQDAETTPTPKATKDCPYCGEEIFEVALKCKHCGEFLSKTTNSTGSSDSRENRLNITPNLIASCKKRIPNYAGLWLRFCAYFVDFCILLAIVGCSSFILFFLFGTPENGSESIFIIITIILITWLYNASFQSSEKQGTPGKILLGIKITDLNGNRISFGRATARYLLEYGYGNAIVFIFGLYVDLKEPGYALICSIILLANYLILLFNEKKQCLHDMISGCLVIKR